MTAPGSARKRAPKSARSQSLASLGLRRLEKFSTLAPRLLVNDDADLIHDVRVWSRRLQQIIAVLAANPTEPRRKKITRALRRIRRAWGNCRNLDVLLKLTNGRADRAKPGAKREGWRRFESYLHERRRRAVKRGRDKFAAQDLTELLSKSREAIEPENGEEPMRAALADGIRDAAMAWRQALAQAVETPDSAHLHALRIAGKTLRYRSELAGALGDAEAGQRVKALRRLQNRLGDWHDRQVLVLAIAKCLSRKRFLAEQPDIARAMLGELAGEKRRGEAAVAALLREAELAAATVAAGAAPHPETEA